MPITTAGRNAIAAAIVSSNLITHLGVGNSSTAFAIGQTDLVGASKTRKAVDATPGVATNVITAVATFGNGDANHAWDEVGAFSAATAGTMLSRVVIALGTKTSASTWVLTYSLTLTLA